MSFQVPGPSASWLAPAAAGSSSLCVTPGRELRQSDGQGIHSRVRIPLGLVVPFARRVAEARRNGRCVTVAKRVFDVTASCVALTLFAPVVTAAAIWIRIHDGGLVLFRQERVGRGGRPFSILELRTMQDQVVTRLGFDRVPERSAIRPGITGPAQLFAPDTAARVLDADLRYVRAASLAVDAEFVAWSFAMNVVGKTPGGARNNPLNAKSSWYSRQ